MVDQKINLKEIQKGIEAFHRFMLDPGEIARFIGEMYEIYSIKQSQLIKRLSNK